MFEVQNFYFPTVELSKKKKKRKKKKKEKVVVHCSLFVEVSKLANMAAKIMYEF